MNNQLKEAIKKLENTLDLALSTMLSQEKHSPETELALKRLNDFSKKLLSYGSEKSEKIGRDAIIYKSEVDTIARNFNESEYQTTNG